MRMQQAIETEPGTGAARRRGVGIRGKLFLAFGGVAGLTVMASVVALLSYNDVGMTLRGITEDNLPAMSLSLKLAKSSAQVASAAPAVLAAGDMGQRDAAVAALAGNQHALDEVIDALAATAGGKQATAGLRQTAGEMRGNLDRLSAAVGQRLALRDQRMTMVQAIRATADTFDKKLTPLVDDTNFTLVTGLQGAADDTSDAKVIQQRLSDIADKQLGALQAMLDLRADGNLALGLLTEAANIPDKDLLPPVRDRFAAAAARIGKALDALKATPAAGALAGPVTDLLRYGSGAANIFDLRRQEIEATTAGETILVANRKLADALAPLVAALVEHNERAAQEAAADTRQAIAHGRVLLIGIAAASLVIALLIVVFYVGRMVVRRLTALRHAMAEIAAGDLDAAIPQTGRDEITEMAAALVVFRQNAQEARALQAAADREQALKERRQAAMDGYTHDFGTSAAGVMANLSRSAETMRATAAEMLEMARTTRHGASRTAEGATVSVENLAAVAAAAEEMAVSIGEISRQVARATNVAHVAVQRALETDSKVAGMAELAAQVGDVVRLINDVAGRTSLLALNATIEAARAGDAGKGFAVVAGEVKALATQTAKATDKISTQIAAIRAATAEAVAAVREVGAAIGQVEEVATAIAAAVAEQASVTQDIVTSVCSVTAATQGATKAMHEVSEASERTEAASAKVLAGAADLGRNADTVRGEVTQFLQEMAGASEEGRRKYERIAGNGAEVVLRLPDGANRRVAINDISRGSVSLCCDWWADVGTEVQVELPGANGAAVARTVRSDGGVLGLAFRHDEVTLQHVDHALAFINAQAMKTAA
jgi:methyl-accepting chemotaxis protein